MHIRKNFVFYCEVRGSVCAEGDETQEDSRE